MNTVLDSLLAAFNITLRETDNEATQAAIIAAIATLPAGPGFEFTFRSRTLLWTQYAPNAYEFVRTIDGGLNGEDCSTRVSVDIYKPTPASDAHYAGLE